MIFRYRSPWILALTVACLLVTLQGPARASFFDVFLESWGSTYPTTPPVRTDVYDVLGGGTVRLQVMKQGLMSCGTTLGGTNLATRVAGWDPAGGYGLMAPDSFFDIFMETFGAPGRGGAGTTGLAQRADISSFFDIFTEISIDGGSQRGQLVPVDAGYPPGDVRRFFSVSWVRNFTVCSVGCRVAVPQSPGAHMEYQWLVSVPDSSVGKGVHMAALPTIQMNPEAQSFFDIFVELSLPDLPSGEVPALSLETTSRLMLPTTPDAPSGWGGLKRAYR
jgi:hypothetical protein